MDDGPIPRKHGGRARSVWETSPVTPTHVTVSCRRRVHRREDARSRFVLSTTSKHFKGEWSMRTIARIGATLIVGVWLATPARADIFSFSTGVPDRLLG